MVFAWSFFSAEEASRVCNGVDLLVASGNVTKGKQCVVFQTSCLDFECKFEVEAGLSSIVLVPIRMLAYIEPCALTGPSAEGDIGISIVHLYVHGYEDELVLEVHQTKNSSFVTELDTDTEEDVTMEINVTVVQRPQGVVFGVSRPMSTSYTLPEEQIDTSYLNSDAIIATSPTHLFLLVQSCNCLKLW